ncbi:GDSL-type esterase/lipase family protein [Streptomyces sp. NPDC001139]
MGDSFISGEAGRWQGNGFDNGGDRDGTDRAFVNGAYNPGLIYQFSYGNGCHRSDVAEVTHVTGYQIPTNIACSGATTSNIPRAISGGSSFKGEMPQSDHLAIAAKDRNVKAIVVSIGGNDFGFSDIIKRCIEDYLVGDQCARSAQQDIDFKKPFVIADIHKAVQDIRATMAQSGYSRNQYRLVLQSYPSPVPRSSGIRVNGSAALRAQFGCPLSNPDLDWARDSLVPQISAAISQVAATENAEFLDLSDAFEGKEVCSTGTVNAAINNPPSFNTSEWVRWVGSGLVQGDQQESLHPNAFGQKALGDCLNGLLKSSPGKGARCFNKDNIMRIQRIL